MLRVARARENSAVTVPAPSISVIMSALNAESTISAAINSVLQQSEGNFEFIILDDGSVDRTRSLIAGHPDPRIRLVAGTERLGLARRLNQGIAMARGEFVARMDADDISYPQRFERQLQFLRSRPAVDMVGSAVMAFRERGGAIGVMPVAQEHAEICAHPEAGFALAHPTWFGRIGFFRQFPYDETAMRAQDQELLMRAYRVARFANIPEILLAYRQEAVTVRHVLRGRYQYLKAMRKLLDEDGGRLRFAKGVALQIGRATAVTVLLSAGMEETVLQRRYRPADAQELAGWEACKHAASAKAASLAKVSSP